MTPYIDIHSHRHNDDSEENAIRIYSLRLGIEEYTPTAPFSAGIHPWDVSKESDCESLLENLSAMNVVAIGETGLDFLHDKENIGLQQYIFERQLDIAQARSLPIIIHCVKSFEPIMSALRNYTLPAVIFHGYTGSMEQTQRINESGYYISLGKTSFGSARTAAAISKFPMERIFLETDDSSIEIAEIYNAASIVLDINSDELKSIIYKNYKTIFTNL